MSTVTVPRPIGGLLDLVALEWLARLALASPFLVSGFVKLLDFPGAVEEVTGLGLRPAAPFAAVIITQLGGSALFMTRRFCWLGAGVLAGFTVVATLSAHPLLDLRGRGT